MTQATPFLQRLWRARRAAAALEFALVSLAFFPLCLGIIEAGMLLWTKNAIQATADLTARCVAIASPACAANPAQYAVTTAGQWLSRGIITTAGVTVATGATCSTAPGTMEKVTITSSYFTANLPKPFNGLTLTGNACYPTSP